MYGFCPYVLSDLRTVAGCATPSTKVTPAGFLRSLLQNTPSNVEIINPSDTLRLDDGQGHIRDIILKYSKRVTPGQVGTADACGINMIPEYEETSLAVTNYRSLGIYFNDETMSRYCADRTQPASLPGTPLPEGVIREVIDRVMDAANGILGAVNIDLLTLMSSRFGVNVVTGSNAATPINIPQSTVVNNLDSGITKLLAHASENEVCGDLILVGNGLMNNYNLQLPAAGLAATGIDNSRFTGFSWYNDLYSRAIWGNNHVLGYSRGSLGLVRLNRFTGFRAGRRGNSDFFTMPIPVNCPDCNGDYSTLDFDAQLRYLDCPTVIDGISYGRGWVLNIGLSFGLFSIPIDAYQGGAAYGDAYTDRLFGNNGTLRFVISNT